MAGLNAGVHYDATVTLRFHANDDEDAEDFLDDHIDWPFELQDLQVINDES